MFKQTNVKEIHAFLQSFKRTIAEDRWTFVPRMKNLETLR